MSSNRIQKLAPQTSTSLKNSHPIFKISNVRMHIGRLYFFPNQTQFGKNRISYVVDGSNTAFNIIKSLLERHKATYDVILEVLKTHIVGRLVALEELT